MAGLFFLGPLECGNSECESEIIEYMLENVKPNSVSGLNLFHLLCSAFPLLNLQEKYAGGICKGVIFFLSKNIARSSQIISMLINSSFSPSFQSHFFQELIEILKNYLKNSENISFKFASLYVHEKCAFEKCEKFPCCTRNPCEHSQLSVPDKLKTIFKHEESSGRIEILIYSLLQIVNISPVWSAYKKEVILLLLQGTIHEKIRISCVRVLCSLGEYRVELIEDLDILEISDIKLSPIRLIEIVKKSMLKGQNCTRISEYCIELLKSGVTFNDISGIDKLIQDKKSILFCLLMFKQYLGSEFTDYIRMINSLLYASETVSKKLTTTNIKPEKTIEIAELRAWESLELYDLLKETIQTLSPNLLEFWYGLTSNPLLSQITEKTTEINLFHMYLGRIPPDSFDSLIKTFPFTYQVIDLSQFFAKNLNFIEVYYLLCMIPLHVLVNGSKNTEEFANNLLKLIIDGGVLPTSLEKFSGKAIGVQCELMCKGISRVLSFLACGFDRVEEFVKGFDGVCVYCGENIENFCFSCGKVAYPTVVPISISQEMNFTSVSPIKISMTCIPHSPKRVPLPKQLGKSIKALENGYFCSDLLLNSGVFQLVTLLKHLEKPVALHLPLSCLYFQQPIFSKKPSEFLLYSKLQTNYSLKKISSKNTTPEIVKHMGEVAIWPSSCETLFKLTLSNLSLFKSKLQINFIELISFLNETTLIKWLENCIENPGFLCKLRSEINFDLAGLFLIIQPSLFLALDYSQLLRILLKVSDECDSPLILFYTNIIAEIAWAGDSNRLKSLENFASRVLRGVEGNSITIYDIFKESVGQNYKIALLLLLCKFGLDQSSKDYEVICRFGGGQVEVPESDLKRFFDGYGILKDVFFMKETISQHGKHEARFEWEELFGLAQIMEEMSFPSKQYKLNSVVGLGKICLKLLKNKKNTDYLIHKVLCLCSQLILLDTHIMLQLLDKLVNAHDCCEHHIVILCLCFIARKDILSSKIITFILKQVSELKSLQLCNFMCFEKLLNPKVTVFDKIIKQWRVPEKVLIGILYANLCEAITQNFPILQYAGLSIISEILQFFPDLSRDSLALSLNRASSLQTSRDNIKELPFPLGLYIDEMTGKVGAVSEIEETSEILENNDMASVVSTCNTLYSNSERVHLSKKLLKTIKTQEEIEVIEILSNMYLETVQESEEVQYKNMKSLREWTELLIRMCNIQPLFPVIPLIKVNLELICVVLPKIFNTKTNKIQYFCKYLQDFFQLSNVGHRRLMLKIIEKSEKLYNSIPLEILMTQLIDLQEYPKAMFMIENKIRNRINLENKRFFPELIECEELVWCQQIYSGLYRLRYIEAIPKQCKEHVNEDTEVQVQFCNGNFLLISSLAFEKPNIFYTGACWRIGKSVTAEISTDIESVLANVLNNSQVKNAIENARKALIAKSFIRSAAYSQAYEHILIQHLFENIIEIETGNKNYSEISKRNLVIENKFEYKEIAHRVSLVMYRKKQDLSSVIPVYKDLFKNAIVHKQFEYCKNLITEIKLRHRGLFSPLMMYYEFKYKLLTNSTSQNTKSCIRKLWSQVPYDLEIIPENGNVQNIVLKMKLSLIYLKVKCLEEVKSPDKLAQKYLEKIPNLIVYQRIYLEKGFFVLASHLDRFLFFEINRENLQTVILSAVLYCNSLVHGHSLHYHSLTRLLTLFFGISNIRGDRKDLHDQMKDLAENLPLFIWADRISQLMSGSASPSIPCRSIIAIVLRRLYIKHPQQMPWFIFPLLDSNKTFDDGLKYKIQVVDEVVNFYKTETGVSGETIEKTKDFFKGLVSLCKKDKKTTVANVFKNINSLNLAIPVKENFKITEVDKRKYTYGEDLPGFTTSPVLLKKALEKTTAMHTKAAPVKITITGSDGKDRFFLCKYDRSSDMRKESRVGSIIDYINRLLSMCPDTKRLKLRLPAYSIFNIGSDCGIVEWVDGTLTLKTIFLNLLEENKNKSVEFIKTLSRGGHEDAQTWLDLQKILRPNFYKYFATTFPDCNKRHNARTLYTRSLAAWSIVGYIIGLGDRHCENILFIEATSELIFIDFECIFNMGKILPKPEVVPFRLTPELQSAMGLFFEEAEFVNTCTLVLDCLKSNKSCLLSQFESFVADPLSLRIHNPDIDKHDYNIHNTLKIVETRLDGKKSFNDKELFKSTRHQVEFLVKEATDSEKLRSMFFGWMPWL